MLQSDTSAEQGNRQACRVERYRQGVRDPEGSDGDHGRRGLREGQRHREPHGRDPGLRRRLGHSGGLLRPPLRSPARRARAESVRRAPRRACQEGARGGRSGGAPHAATPLCRHGGRRCRLPSSSCASRTSSGRRGRVARGGGAPSKPSAKELALAEQLIDRMVVDWDPTRYKDTYRDDLLGAIRRKAETGVLEPQHVPAAPQGRPIDLASLLEKSVADAKKRRSRAA